MKQSVKFAAAMGALTLALTACAGNGNVAQQSDGAKAELPFKACAVSDTGGWQDKSFNQSAYDGLMEAKSFLGVTVDTAESDTVEDFTNNVEKMVDDSCTLIIGVGFHLEPAIHESALKHTDRNYALIDSGFSDGTNPVVLENGRPLLFNTSEAAYLAGYASAGMTTTGTLAVIGGSRDNVTASQMDAFAEGVDAYNLAKGTSITILGWNNASKEGTFVDSAENVEATAANFIAQGADIILPLAGENNAGAARAVAAAGNPMVRLIWSGLTKADLKGLTRDEAVSAESPMSGQAGPQVVEQVDTQSFSDSFSYIQITDAVRSSIGAPVLTGIVLDYSAAMDTLISDATAGAPASTVPVSLVSGGVILTGFGAYTPMLSSDLKLGLSDMAGQIETGGMVISTPFDV